MARGSRIAQLALIILGFLAFVMMFAVLFGDGADTGFGWTCDDQGNCNGVTRESPSGFHLGVLLGLLGIGFEVAAVAVGVRGSAAGAAAAGPAAAGPGAAAYAAGGPGAAQPAPGYPNFGTAQPSFGAPSAPFGTSQSAGMGQAPAAAGQPAGMTQPQQPSGFPQQATGSPASITVPTPPGGSSHSGSLSTPQTPPGSPIPAPGSPAAPPGGPSAGRASVPSAGQAGAQPYQSGYAQQGFPPPYGQQQS